MPLFVSKGLNCISHQVLKNAKKLSLLTFDYYFGNIDLNVYLIILEKENIQLTEGSSTFSMVLARYDMMRRWNRRNYLERY